LESLLNCEFFAYELRIKGGAYYGFSALSIAGSEERMKKKSQVLVREGEKSGALIVRNRFTKLKFLVPKNCLQREIRSLSGVSKLDVSDESEFVIGKPYPGLSELLKDIYSDAQAKTFERRIRADWQEKVEHGLSKIVFARKTDLSAQGTCLLSIFSRVPLFLAADTWGIRGISDEDAKILTLWFNSSLFLAEILSKRTQTRGSWGRLDKNLIFEMNCLLPSKLKDGQREMLLNLFENLHDEFPSLLDQLKAGTGARARIDRAFLDVLGYKKDRQNEFIGKIHTSLLRKLLALKETMEED